MKKARGFVLLLILISSCTDKNLILRDESGNSAQYYMLNAQNINTPYHLRLIYSNKAVLALNKQNNDSLNRDELIKIARNYYVLNSWKELKMTSEIALKKSTEKGDSYFIGQSYRWLGVYYENISMNDSAFYYYHKAEKIYKRLNDKVRLCHIYQDKAQIQFYTCDYLMAEASLVKALKIAVKLNLEYEKIRIFQSLGMNSTSQRDYYSSLIYHKKALKISSQQKTEKFKYAQLVSLNNIANAYIDLHHLKKAALVLQASVENIGFLKKAPKEYCCALDLLGLIKLKSKKYDGIENLLFRAAKIRDSLNIDFYRENNKLNLSNYYFETNQFAKAKKFANELYDLALSYNNPSVMQMSLKQLIKVDPKNALKYSQEYIRISDSMQQLERETRNKFAKIAYETDEIIKEKESAEKKSRIISATASGLILVLVLLLIIIVQRTKQKRLELEQVQQKANEEIYNLLLDKQNKIDRGRKIEKKRIAQDLHDSVLNRLASTRLNLHNIAENPDAEKLQKCLPFIDGIQDIEKEIRNIAHDLNRGAFSNAISFLEVIESFIEEQQTLSNRKQHLEIDPTIDWELLSSNKKIHIFRILQEAFQNINKHSGAKSVMVSLLKRDEHILLEIFDDGDGFSFNEKKKGIGLQNIFSRAHSCGGSAQVKSRVHEGTTVIVKIPL